MVNTRRPHPDTGLTLAEPCATQYNLGAGKRLLLGISPKGSKLWIFNYSRPYSRQLAKLGLGSTPDLSLREARKKAPVFHIALGPEECREELGLERFNVTETCHDKITNRVSLCAPKPDRVPIHKAHANCGYRNNLAPLGPAAVGADEYQRALVH